MYPPGVARRIRDDLNRDVVFLRAPQRIVSLVPSDTDTLFALGVGDRVVGRTRYCTEPAERVDDIPICGGTKDIDVAAVTELRPDLILCNQEENSRSHLEALAQSGHQVFVSLPRRAADGIAHIARLARMLEIGDHPEVRDLVRRGHHVISEADKTAHPIDASLASLPSDRTGDNAPLPVFVPIWKDPLMTFNGDTFGSDMLSMAGARNIFADRLRLYPLAADLGKAEPLAEEEVGDRDVRYPRITMDEVRARSPEAILLPDEPFAFGPADVADYRDVAVPAAEHDAIQLVSGKDLFWYGAWTIDALPRLRQLIREMAKLRA